MFLLLLLLLLVLVFIIFQYNFAFYLGLVFCHILFKSQNKHSKSNKNNVLENKYHHRHDDRGEHRIEVESITKKKKQKKIPGKQQQKLNDI